MTPEQRMTCAVANNPEIGRYRLAELAEVSEKQARTFLKNNPERRQFLSVVKLCDWHVPHHDEQAVECAFNFCERVQPNIILIDEIHDFYDLSRFCKDPMRTQTLQDEIDIATKYLRRLKKICPGSRIILLGSNHLDRLRRFLWETGKALTSLRALQVEKLLELPEIGIEYAENFHHKGFLFKHGHIVRKHSGYTAKGEFDKEGCAGATGHTHRLGMHFVTKRGGSYVWVEGGCLCDLNPEYIDGVADWQQGLVHVTFEHEGNQYFPQAIPIIKGKMIYGGELITS